MERLGALKKEPNEQTMNVLMDYLDHHQDAIDLKLSAVLGHIEAQPDAQAKKTLLEHPAIQQTVTDKRLNELLSNFEEQPSIQFNPNWTKTKNRKYVPIALSIVLAALSIVFNQSILDNKGKQIISNEVITNSNVENSDILESEQSDKQTLEQTPIKRNENDFSIKNSQGPSNKYEMEKENNHTVAEDHASDGKQNHLDFSSSILPLKHIKAFDWSFEPAKYSTRKAKTYYPPKPVALPIQIGLWTGVSMENRMNASVHSDKVHKDYMTLYAQGDAKIKSGKSIYLSLHYQLNRKIGIQAGYQYSRTSASTQMQYIYTDIPVYDTTGKILGYIIKPPSSSQHINETLTSTTSTSSIPVQLNMALIGFGKWTVYGGLGIHLQLKRQIEFSTFNFNQSRVDRHSERIGAHINPLANLQIRRQMSAQFSIGINCQFNTQGLRIKDSNADLRGNIFKSNYQIGIIYTPVIKP